MKYCRRCGGCCINPYIGEKFNEKESDYYSFVKLSSRGYKISAIFGAGDRLGDDIREKEIYKEHVLCRACTNLFLDFIRGFTVVGKDRDRYLPKKKWWQIFG